MSLEQAHRPKSESRQKIIDAVEKSDKPLTRTQIARALDREKTPHLIDLIESLVSEGVLVRGSRTFRNKVVGYVYELSETAEESQS